MPCQLADGAEVGRLALVDGAGDAEFPVGEGAGEVAGVLAGDGLLAVDELLVGAGAADGDVAGEATGDGGTAGAGTGVGSVALAAVLGNRVMTGSVGAGVFLAAAGADAGAKAGEAATWVGRPRQLGPAAAVLAAVAGKPTESVGPTRYTMAPMTTVAGIAVAVASRMRRHPTPVRAGLPGALRRCRPRPASSRSSKVNSGSCASAVVVRPRRRNRLCDRADTRRLRSVYR